ncbi:SDR family oxidoreductase [Halobaculum marinum]|uniref:SDR family oxidoreductase n=1 Tax=Halobaculum marinum TaxID=3031996 RepID=A0ABD5WZB4_9EURY|nr:SDR family oxidoreductase [Halobaculum sp. DT55]
MAPTTAAESVVLLTGGTSGIGRAAVRRLAATGATVVTVGRDRERGRAVAADVTAETPGRVEFRRVDLADQSAVRNLASAVDDEYDRLDALVHNAGLSSKERRETADGVELTLAVNHLAPYLLTHDLVDLLGATRGARVVVTASSVHRRGKIDLDDSEDLDALNSRSGYDALDAYARSKLANVAFTLELAERLRASARTEGVVANCVHPGFIPTTGLYRDVSWRAKLLTRLAGAVPGVGTDVEEGARRLVAVTTDDAYADRTGLYVGGDGPEQPSAAARDAALRERLWRLSAALVGVDPDWP